jgi:predicted ribosomally synthesized peptide with SipW-like signal peptide
VKGGLTNVRKFIIALLATALALGIMGGAFAYFSDTETSTDNTFTAGTLDLQVKDNDDTWGDGCTSTWMLPNIVPGSDQAGIDKVTATVDLRRMGTITPDHLEIQVLVSLDESVNPVESDTNPASTPNEMAAKLEILSMQYDGLDLLDYLVDVDGDFVLTLNDMTYIAEVNGLDNLHIPGSGPDLSTPFALTLRWIEGSDDNDFQGDTLVAAIAFTLNQHSSQ